MSLAYTSPPVGAATEEFIDHSAIHAVYESVLKSCGDEMVAVNMAITAGRAMLNTRKNYVNPDSRKVFDIMKKETNGTVKTADALYIASMATGNGVDYPFCCIMAALRRNDVKFDGVKCGNNNDKDDEDNDNNKDDEDDEDSGCKHGAECKKCNLESELFGIFEGVEATAEDSLVMTSPGFSPIYVANMAANITANIIDSNKRYAGYIIKPEYSIYADNWTATVALRRKEDNTPMPENTEYTIHGVDWIAYVTVKNNHGERPWIHGVTFKVDGCTMVSVSPPITPPPVTTPVATTVAEGVNTVKDFNSLVENVNSIRMALGAVLSDMKKLEKQIPVRS
jgi:hypothetical protein